MIHGDSKIDNFLFKKVAYSIEEQYTAVLIDWQVREDTVVKFRLYPTDPFKSLELKHPSIDKFYFVRDRHGNDL